MIKLAFTINREIFRIEITNKEIWYGDRKWGRLIRLIPKDDRFIRKILESRNKLPRILINMFELTEKEQEEYDNAKNDDELAKICIKDCRMKGAQLLKQENV